MFPPLRSCDVTAKRVFTKNWFTFLIKLLDIPEFFSLFEKHVQCPFLRLPHSKVSCFCDYDFPFPFMSVNTHPEFKLANIGNGKKICMEKVAGLQGLP